MAKFMINTGDAQWSCRPSMGAALRFYEETKKEVTEINVNSLTELCTYLWCCVASAANHDHKQFDMSLMDFADSIDQSDLIGWANSLAADQSDATEKAGKKKAKRPS